MDENNFFPDEIPKKSSHQKIDDFANLKDNTMDFLSRERSEKFDQEKPKVDVDDFLNFHDNFDESKSKAAFSIPNIEKSEPEIIKPEPSVPQPEPEIDFHAIDDEFLKGFESNKEKFISSEDLLTDFKDPVSAPVEALAPATVTAPVPIPAPLPVVIEKPPVTEPIKPVVEPVKPKSAPPPAPVKKTTSDDTQIEAEKLFKSIGLG